MQGGLGGLESPCLGFMADALQSVLRRYIAQQACTEPFMRAMPAEFVNTLGEWHRQQREWTAVYELEKLVRQMVPMEVQIRALCRIENGTRKFRDTLAL